MGAVERRTARISYTVLCGVTVDDEQLKQCAQLFSTHYGTWSNQGPKPGKPVALRASRLRQQSLFDPDTCSLVIAKAGEELVGHAFVTKFWSSKLGGHAYWITQLVVHEAHRSQGIGSTLCRHAIANGPGDVAWGLVSSHPHAVRALENAAQQRCDPRLIGQHAAELITASRIPYVQGCSVWGCTINTSYHVDHTIPKQLLAQLWPPRWLLGSLQEGCEFFAFTFASDAPPQSSPTEEQ